MTVISMDVRPNKQVSQPKLALDKGTRDAMADYFRLRWPSNTAKLGAREFGLTLDQGQSVVKGRASLTTLDQIEKAGGWPVIFAVKALVVGQGADQFLAEIGASHEHHAERYRALLGFLRPVAADPAYRDPEPAVPLDERRRFDRHREASRQG